VTSRRKAEALIAGGRVSVNGKVVTELGRRVNPVDDHIRVEGRALRRASPPIYLLLNKPAGVMTTLDDEDERPTVGKLIASRSRSRVFPVGRLDFDAEGVLLLTSDGPLAHRLTHPSFRVAKVYRAKVKGSPSPETVRMLEEGVRLDDGQAQAEQVAVEPTRRGNAWVRLLVREGRQHLVKRLLERVGHPVIRLKRIRFAGLGVEGLAPGELRSLTEDEVKRLRTRGRKRSVREGRGRRTEEG